MLFGCLTFLGLFRPSGFELWQIREIHKLTEQLKFDQNASFVGLTKSSVQTMNELNARLDRSMTETKFKFMKIWFSDLKNKLIHLPQNHQWRDNTQPRDRISNLTQFLNHPPPKELWKIESHFRVVNVETADSKLSKEIGQTFPYLDQRYKVLNRSEYLSTHYQEIMTKYPRIAHAMERLIYSIELEGKNGMRVTFLNQQLHSADALWGEIQRRQITTKQPAEKQLDELVQILENVYNSLSEMRS